MIFRHRRLLPTLIALVTWSGGAVALTIWAVGVATPAALCFAAATSVLWATGLRSAALWFRARGFRARGFRARGIRAWGFRARGTRAATGVDPESQPSGSAAARATVRVALLYCVADDFEPAVVAAGMAQDVPVATVVLDDSATPAGRARVDAFARTHGAHVIRRADRSGYKAGNLSHGVATLRGRFDAFVICDSDVVLPPDLVRRCADALDDPTVAIAQASPTAGRGRSRFARYFGPLLATHLDVTRRGRAALGVTAFLGRGALVRASAIDDVGGFPAAVAEDLALTVALRGRGWRIVDVDVSFTEDYPIDYRAFRTQMRKTAEGAVEFLRTGLELRRLSLRERWDVLTETALVPAAALAGVIGLVSGTVSTFSGAVPPPWIMVLSALAAAVPLLPEAVRRARSERVAAGIAFALIAGALYASTMFVVVAAVVRTAVGRRAVFWITPKSVERLGVADRLALLRAEMVVVPALAMLTAGLSGTPVAAGAVAGPLLAVLAFAAPVLSGRGGAPADPAAPSRPLALAAV